MNGISIKDIYVIKKLAILHVYTARIIILFKFTCYVFYFVMDFDIIFPFSLLSTLFPTFFIHQNEVSCEEISGGLKRVTFARTPIMSTYLLAFIVGEYDCVEATDVNGVRVRVFTPLGKAEEGRFALDVS